MGPTKNKWYPENVIPRGLSCLQQKLDKMFHMAVNKILFATVALETPVVREINVINVVSP